MYRKAIIEFEKAVTLLNNWMLIFQDDEEDLIEIKAELLMSLATNYEFLEKPIIMLNYC